MKLNIKYPTIVQMTMGVNIYWTLNQLYKLNENDEYNCWLTTSKSNVPIRSWSYWKSCICPSILSQPRHISKVVQNAYVVNRMREWIMMNETEIVEIDALLKWKRIVDMHLPSDISFVNEWFVETSAPSCLHPITVGHSMIVSRVLIRLVQVECWKLPMGNTKQTADSKATFV